MPESRRRLPHRYPGGKWLFVTWHLHGSLPQALYPPPGKLSSGSAFVWMDQYLDQARSGPMYLAQEPMARLLVASLRRGVLLGHYELGAYAIMANHVHVLLLPKVSPSRLLQSVKGATARQANLILGRTGETFWQAELRPLGKRRERMAPDCRVYRKPPGESGAGVTGGGLPMVERGRAKRERRDESRRGSHEWLRHGQPRTFRN